MDKLKKIFGKILCFIGIHIWSNWEKKTYKVEGHNYQTLEGIDYWEYVEERQCKRCKQEDENTIDSGLY